MRVVIPPSSSGAAAFERIECHNGRGCANSLLRAPSPGTRTPLPAWDAREEGLRLVDGDDVRAGWL